MNKLYILIFFFSLLNISADAQFDNLLKKGQDLIGVNKTDQTSNALKQALNFGAEEAVEQLSAERGYLDGPYKILVPEEAQTVISKVKMVPGFQNVEKDLIAKMNEAAELAAKEAVPIFVGAIKDMSIQDASAILMGKDDAATQYLKAKTHDNLYEAFMPVVRRSLDEVNARSYWQSAVGAYNNIPFTKKMNPELDDHVNRMALEGMYSLIKIKEKDIRTDVGQRTTDLLKDVFAKQDQK